MIQVSNVVHHYLRYGKTEQDTSSVRALDHVDMQIEDGQFIGIIGCNGSGKSTLAKHFNGLLTPSEGEVTVDGISAGEESNLEEIRRRVCMVFQNPDNQIVGATVEEDIAFGLENMRVPAEQMQGRIDASLDAVRMQPKRNANPGELSGGEKQKTAIAGAIAIAPKCLVLDEATAMLDPAARREVVRIARRLNEEQKITVILITHHMEELAAADKIFLMNKGKVVFSGTPREMFAQNTLLEECHMEVPAVTRLALRLKERGLALELPVLDMQELMAQIDRIMEGEDDED